MMGAFDNLSEDYAFWIDRVNPAHYDRILAGLIPDRVEMALDIGAGPGKLAAFLARHSRHVVALDLSTKMLRLSMEKASTGDLSNIRHVCGDLRRLPFREGVFDFIGSDCALHDTDIDSVLPAIISRLRPGGRLYIRDLVSRNARLSRSAAWHILRTFKNIPRYLRRTGLIDSLRLLSFELSPGWVRHKISGANLLTGQYARLFETYLPGCKQIDYGWARAAYWRKPEN